MKLGERPAAAGGGCGFFRTHNPAGLVKWNKEQQRLDFEEWFKRIRIAAAAFSFRAPDVCHNPVGVDPDLSSFTQGRLADSPTLGFEAQSLWDWRDSRALTPEPRPGVQRRNLWDMRGKIIAQFRKEGGDLEMGLGSGASTQV